MNGRGTLRGMAAGLLWSISAMAQDKPKAPPAVPVEVREQFFKAQSEALQAQEAAKAADTEAKAKLDAFNAAVKKAQDSCGQDHQLSLDKDRDLTCVDKPKPAKTEAGPAKK